MLHSLALGFIDVGISLFIHPLFHNFCLSLSGIFRSIGRAFVLMNIGFHPNGSNFRHFFQTSNWERKNLVNSIHTVLSNGPSRRALFCAHIHPIANNRNIIQFNFHKSNNQISQMPFICMSQKPKAKEETQIAWTTEHFVPLYTNTIYIYSIVCDMCIYIWCDAQ